MCAIIGQAITTEQHRQEMRETLTKLAPAIDKWSSMATSGLVSKAALYPLPTESLGGPENLPAAPTVDVGGEVPRRRTHPHLPHGRAADLFSTPLFTVNLLDVGVETSETGFNDALAAFATEKYTAYGQRADVLNDDGTVPSPTELSNLSVIFF